MNTLLFNKQMHDFGVVEKNSVQTTTFQFLGSEELTPSDFIASCTCTAGAYDPKKKAYTVGLKTDQVGERSTTVRVKENTFLILKMTVV